MTNNQEYWTFERNGVIYDDAFKSKDHAEDYANNIYAEECEENSPRNGEIFNEDFVLIRFKYDENDDVVILERINAVLEYEHYHGDFCEHNTLWNA